jgi:hypothetical protein
MIRRINATACTRPFASSRASSCMPAGKSLSCWKNMPAIMTRLVRIAVRKNKGEVSRRATLRQLQADHDNLWAALAWMLDHHHALALQLAANLGAALKFWELGGYFQEGRHWLTRILEATEGTVSAPRARALAGCLDPLLRHFRFGVWASLAQRRAGECFTNWVTGAAK